MTPALAIALLGLGAAGVWFVTRSSAGSSSLPAGSSTAFLQGTSTVPGAVSSTPGSNSSWNPAQLGQAGVGAGVAAAGAFGATAALWATGVGAIAGVALLVYQINHNDTFVDRIEFAEKLGFGSGRGAYDRLLELLRRVGRDDLAHTALNVIGKKDMPMNQAWMNDVLVALQAAINAGQWDGVPTKPTSSFFGRR